MTLDDTLADTGTKKQGPWVSVKGYTRFLLFTVTNRRGSSQGISTQALVNPKHSRDGVVDFGHVGFTAGTDWRLGFNEDGSVCVHPSNNELCPRYETRYSYWLTREHQYFAFEYVVGQQGGGPATYKAWLYGIK